MRFAQYRSPWAVAQQVTTGAEMPRYSRDGPVHVLPAYGVAVGVGHRPLPQHPPQVGPPGVGQPEVVWRIGSSDRTGWSTGTDSSAR